MRKFLCTMDPMLASFGIIIVVLYGALAFHEGFRMLMIIGIGAVLCGIILGIAFGLYKVIVYAQSKCKENQ